MVHLFCTSMSGPSWLIDSTRIATKIKCASESSDLARFTWKSNPTRNCPRCNHVIDNSDVSKDWPGLPRGVKFDPSDQELLWHLLAKFGNCNAKPHPFIDEFIPTIEGGDGICYTHPEKLPGVKQDGSVSHFFHRTYKAYSTGTRKRRKIQTEAPGDVRWHKTGKTKPVLLDGVHQGMKKIMVLYMSTAKGGKPVKTNWVMHQYHLGTAEDEKDGEYVVSKISYQQQSKQNDKNESHPSPDATVENASEADMVTNPKLATPELPLEKRMHIMNSEQPNGSISGVTNFETEITENTNRPNGENIEDNEVNSEDPKWWEGESQFLLNSQQLAEGIALCEEFLQSQSSSGGGEETRGSKPSLADYAVMGVDALKRDLEECQKLSVADHPDITLDTPPDIRLSQLDFGSQDSFPAWGGTAKFTD